MKLPLLALACSIAISASLYADWEIGAELSHADLSGVRAYAASKNPNRNLTDSLVVPSIKLSKSVTENSKLTLRYAYYDEIKMEGISGSADVFGEHEVSAAVMTPYKGIDEINEFCLSYLYNFGALGKMELWFGPNISAYDSNTVIYSRRYTSLDCALGIEAISSFAVSDNLGLDLSYRFSNPPDRDIHLFSLSLNLKL